MRNLLVALAMAFCAGSASAADTAAPAPAATLKGTVLEVKDVESFTYLRLKTSDGEIWAAVPKAPIKTGAEVTVQNVTLMNDFESKSLKRKFDKIAFGSLVGAPKTAGTPSGEVAAAHAGVASAPDAGDVKVAKATGPNAHTVAEIVTGKADLKNKPVVVRGKVVKFTGEVMGKNWIHLRDGSGSAPAGTDDVLVTTKDEAKIGDVVLVKGVVQTDRDFGSGYSYKVLIEDATLQK